MKRNKSGISLIVLVITIIVMIILAAAIIISLTNSGIIGKANTAVEQSNLKQVQQIASLAWSEAYIAKMENKDVDLEDEVYKALEANKIDTTKYNIEVTENGVTVTERVEGINQYGFYFDVPYVDNYNEENGELYYYVFKSNNTVEFYYSSSNDNLDCVYNGYGQVEYEKGKIIANEGEMQFNISEDGKTLTDSEDSDYSIVYTDKTYRDVYYGEKYYIYDDNDRFNNDFSYIIFKSDNSVEIYGSTDNLILTVSATKTLHLFEGVIEGKTHIIAISMGGETIATTNGNGFYKPSYAKLAIPPSNEMPSFTIVGEGGTRTCSYELGMTWEQWLGSDYDELTTSFELLSYRKLIYLESAIGSANVFYRTEDINSHYVAYTDTINSDYTYLLKRYAD